MVPGRFSLRVRTLQKSKWIGRTSTIIGREAGLSSAERESIMASIIVLGFLVQGFGWALVAVLAAGMAALYMEGKIGFCISECETIEEMAAIEGARAELAERLRRRSIEAQKKARESQAQYIELDIALDEVNEVIREAMLKSISERIYAEAEAARFELAAQSPQYWSVWETTEMLTVRLNNLRNASIEKLQSIHGIGKKRALRIYLAGETLTLEKLKEICRSPNVLNNTLTFA